MNKATFYPIHNPDCLAKFKMTDLERIERSVFKILTRSEKLLRDSQLGFDKNRQLSYVDVCQVNYDIWMQVRRELDNRMEIISIEDILNIPVSTDSIQQGEG